MLFMMIVVLGALAIAALPQWEYSRNWDYAPSGTLGAFLVVMVALMLMGRI